MNLIKPILNLLSGKKRKPDEPAVAEHTVQTFRELIHTPAWKDYKIFLDSIVSTQVQALLAAGDTTECHRQRGYIQGLLHAVQIVESLVAQDDNARKRESRSVSTAAGRAESERAAAFGTPFWGN